MSSEHTFRTFLNNHISVIEPLNYVEALANWEMQTTGSGAAEERSKELRTRIALIYSDAVSCALLQNTSPDSLSDPLLRRQLSILLNSFLAHQIDPFILEDMVELEVKIDSVFNHHRASLNGKLVSDNEIEQVLNTSLDSGARKLAWESSKTVGKSAESLILKLVRLRNREAKRLGYQDYYHMRIQLQELDVDTLFSLLHDLEVRSSSLWSSYRIKLDIQLAAKFGIAPEDIRPWHHGNPFFQSAEHGELDLDHLFAGKDIEAMNLSFYQNIGLPIEDMMIRSDLYERPGKCQHAFCMDMDRKGDVRVLCNLRPNLQWMTTLLHEFGHAVYDKFSNPQLPYLLRGPAHTMTTEAVALLMGRMARDSQWLITYAGAPETEAMQQGKAARKEESEGLLVFLHWCLVMSHFERALYADPEQDLNTLWWKLVNRFQKMVPLQERCEPDWAAKIHLASAPVYYHNYLLGEMMASQIRMYIEKVILEEESSAAFVKSPEVGAYMQEALFRPGAVHPWNEWIQKATQESLNPDYFIKDITGEAGQ